MIRGLEIAASGMLAQRKRMDVLVNNIANTGTAGYKKDELLTRSFGDVLLQCANAAGESGSSDVGPLNYGIYAGETSTCFSQGQLMDSGLTTDMALDGEGFFTVMTPAGERYTRAGNFNVDSEGYLCTGAGYRLMGMDGPAHVGDGPFTVDAKGNVKGRYASNSLKIVAFADNSLLAKIGNNLYSAGGQTADDAVDYRVRQGFLEDSNMDIAQEMVNMMQVSRSYETNIRVINMIDGTLGKAVNEIARMG